MAAYVATIFPHGGALIYGSQEVGHETPINFFHYVPVDWSAHPDLYKEYQHLIGLYNDYTALRKAQANYYPDKDILMFEKADDAAKFLVAVNVRNQEKCIASPEGWQGASVSDMETGAAFEMKDSLRLQPFEYKILKK